MMLFKEDCYWYDEWGDMNALIPYCKAGKNMDRSGMRLESCDGCEEYHSRGKRTNADKIRTMTNEELAETITKDWCSIVCPGGSFFCDGDCVTKITEWLKQEVK